MFRKTRGIPEARSRLCVCLASFLMTFAIGEIPHTGSGQHPLQYSCLENSMDRRAWWADAGSQREESRPWQWSWGRKPDKMQRCDLASGVPPEFSWTSTPQNQSLPALLHIKRMSPSEPPLDGSLTCLTGSPELFTICELFTAPQPQEAQSLKHLKDTEPFLKS